MSTAQIETTLKAWAKNVWTKILNKHNNDEKNRKNWVNEIKKKYTKFQRRNKRVHTKSSRHKYLEIVYNFLVNELPFWKIGVICCLCSFTWFALSEIKVKCSIFSPATKKNSECAEFWTQTQPLHTTTQIKCDLVHLSVSRRCATILLHETKKKLLPFTCVVFISTRIHILNTDTDTHIDYYINYITAAMLTEKEQCAIYILLWSQVDFHNDIERVAHPLSLLSKKKQGINSHSLANWTDWANDEKNKNVFGTFSSRTIRIWQIKAHYVLTVARNTPKKETTNKMILK